MFRRGARRRFQIDLRALATLRIALGLLLLVDLALRLPDVTAFYSDQGFLPRDRLAAYFPWFPYVSLHALSGAAAFQVLLLGLAILAAVALALGYRSRFAIVASFLLLVSLDARNPLVLDSGDSLLVLLLFWSMFLPLGERWSLDARGRAAPAEPHVLAVAGLGLLVQVVLVYTVNAVFKARSDAWRDGDALAYVFRLEYFSTPLAEALTGMPGLLAVLGIGWFLLLSVSFLLLVLDGWPRVVLVGLFASAHIGMAATVPLGIFPWISIAALLPFLPPLLWDHVERTVAIRLPKPTPVASASRVRTPQPFEGPLRTGRDSVLGSLLIVTLLLNASSLGWIKPPDSLAEATAPHASGWVMFAPPPRADHWYIAPSNVSGTQTDVLFGGEPSWQEPPPMPNIRWRNHLLDIRRQGPDEVAMMEDLARYLCRHNEGAPDQVSVVHLLRAVDLEGRPQPVHQADRVQVQCGVP